MQNREQIASSRRWVVKVGSALLTNEGQGIDGEFMSSLVAQIAEQRQRGREVVLVSSGSVAEGLSRLGWKRRPHELFRLQAAAAIGQMGLVQAYESRFKQFGLQTAQVLLTHEDLSDRRRYLNARSTLSALIGLGVIPVVNENDTVATEEIRLGDNDTLAALVANLVEADLMLILTDQEGIFDADPRSSANATLIGTTEVGDPQLDAVASGRGGALGRGGMLTKVQAARRAARSGTATVITHGRNPELLQQVADGRAPGTLLVPPAERMASRKRWLAGQLQVTGRATLDAGAVKVLRESGCSLLPIGVTAVGGDFVRGDLVSCLDPDGAEVARGLVNYSAQEARRIIGQPSDRIESLLGYVDEPELIHRDNLVLV